MSWAKKAAQIYNHQPGCVKGGLISEVFSFWVQSSKIVEINHFGKSSLKPPNFYSRLSLVFHIKSEIYTLKWQESS